MRLRAARNDINKGSPARKDGRSQPPPIPREFFWIQVTQLFNQSLGSSYTVKEVCEIPGDLFEMMLAYCNG